jgi:hypothetical protein
MKTILFLAIMLLLIVPVSAQSKTDSVGTANTFWQKIELLRGGANVLTEVINDGNTNYMLVATTSQDTVSTRTRYQTKILPYESIMFYTNQLYVYVKTGTSTSAYRVKTY